jgi:hypothetical protein
MTDEPGFLPHEIELGEDQSSPFPWRGCLAYLLVIVAAGYGVWKLAGL